MSKATEDFFRELRQQTLAKQQKSQAFRWARRQDKLKDRIEKIEEKKETAAIEKEISEYPFIIKPFSR